MRKRAFIMMMVLSLLVSGSGMVALAADASTVATIDEVAYTSLQAAVYAVAEGTQEGVVVLQKDTNENIKVIADVCVDLNGNNVKSVTVESGTFSGMDSQTADFASKSADDYGTIGTFSGDVQAAFPPEVDGCGYLMFSQENTNASFHYVQMQITDMVLRPKNEGETDYNPSLYYKCSFAGDEVVAANVESFGVAMSLENEPCNLQLSQCGYTKFTNFAPGAQGNSQCSTLLHGIMKEGNLDHVNKRNADLRVYGQAYLKLKNRDYLFSNAQSRTLKEQTELANRLWTVLDSPEKDGIREMFSRYTNIMQDWSLSALSEPYAEVVQDAVTWYQEFEKLPIANANMTVDELRQLTVDFFRLQQSFKWTPNTTFVYHDTEKFYSGSQAGSFSDYTTLEPNVVYKGLPYCMTGAYHVIDGEDQVTTPTTTIGQSGSIYKAMNYYDPATGVLDIATIYEKGGAQAVYDVLTSNCTNGLTWGWSRISNSTTIYSTRHYTPANGAIPVGYYVWNEAEMSYVETTYKENGEPVYEIKTVEDAVAKIIAAQDGNEKGRFRKAYAQLQPGDGLVTDGHLRMCTGVRVKKDAGGNILPNESYVWYIDMNPYGSTDRYVKEGGDHEDHTYKQDNEHLVRDLGGIREHLDREGLNDYPGTPINFTDLLNAKYIPVTIPEFSTVDSIKKIRDQSRADFEAAGKLEVWQEVYAPRYQAMIEKAGIEAPVVTTSGGLSDKSAVTPTYFTQTYNGSISANYTISNVRITLKDSKGDILEEENPLVYTRNRTMSLKLKNTVVPVSDLLSEETLSKYAGQGNRIIISVCLSTGEWKEVANARINAG